jgi:hypothetical protein
MPHLLSFRRGWESENLARFILSKFCFLANPATVADDIGSDFYCTLLQFQKVGRNTFLTPKNAFAIQIKSDSSNIDLSDKVSYLENLELPYFVGVVDRKDLSLTIYSGHYLPVFFSHWGVPTHLEIELCEPEKIQRLNDYVDSIGEAAFTLRFPKFLTIDAAVDSAGLQEKANWLSRLCSLMLQNIAAKLSHEYTFLIPPTDADFGPGVSVVCSLEQFAGPVSVRYFRRNLLRRLGEVIQNLTWLWQNGAPSSFSDEFSLFRSLINGLETVYSGDQDYENLRQQLRGLEQLIDNR